MKKPKFYYIIGLAGVDHTENKRARFVGKLFEVPMLILAFWMLLLWYMDVTHNVRPELVAHTDFIVWLFFIFELFALTFLVDKRIRYLSSNWMNVVIILFGASIIWGDMHYMAALRTGRLLIIFVLYLSVFDSVLEVLAKKKLGLTIAISFVTILVAGIIISVFDPGIKDPWEGLWWAWVTVTTVGYGDVVPISPVGKIMGGLLILMGVGLFSMLTASFSAFLVSKDSSELESKEEKAIKLLSELNENIKQINQRLTVIEQQQQLQQKNKDADSDK